ncbi:type II secretion system F family protein [Texcoconibacillus texcoconensis]|uniref:Tight adherence protein B n=1 Tax=Texcoconibacillus texcoconensis TaxID=1095777 RepID=A0A840QQ79_9BACI|nr:type II secretion system F family protein [Texcoconibacillus texcoconensis]MBB5173483.1 tight adherence protein B [Texcoconibacillus texcoconensis]
MFVILALIFTLIFGFIGSFIVKRKKRYEKRIEKYLTKQDRNQGSSEDEEEGKEAKKPLEQLIIRLGRVFAGKKIANKWKEKLAQANMDIKAEHFIAKRMIYALFAGLFAFAINMTAMMIFFALIGYLLPVIQVNRKIKKRLSISETQLPQALGTMSSAMKSGFSFLQAMQLVGREMDDPIGTEFNRVIRQINLGTSMEDAFGQLLDRLPNQDMELMVNAVLVQRTTGGNLTEILEMMQETIRERVRFREELKSLTAQGRMSAIIISMLPVAIGLFLAFIDPEYFTPLLNHPVGWAMIGFGIISGLFGWFVIQKIVTIEV